MVRGQERGFVWAVCLVRAKDAPGWAGLGEAAQVHSQVEGTGTDRATTGSLLPDAAASQGSETRSSACMACTRTHTDTRVHGHPAPPCDSSEAPAPSLHRPQPALCSMTSHCPMVSRWMTSRQGHPVTSQDSEGCKGPDVSQILPCSPLKLPCFPGEPNWGFTRTPAAPPSRTLKRNNHDCLNLI